MRNAEMQFVYPMFAAAATSALPNRSALEPLGAVYALTATSTVTQKLSSKWLGDRSLCDLTDRF